MDRFDPEALRVFAAEMLVAAGMPPDKAQAVARGLVEADLYGHTTHGLALLADYVEEVESGEMACAGEPEVLASMGAVATWDARRLPGVWVTGKAVQEAVERAQRFGIGAVAVRRSHHIACLASYLEEPARRGFLVLVLSSDPADAMVAPGGGRAPVITPNPIAAGIPRSGEPILLDVSTSITTAGMCGRARSRGERLPGRWLVDSAGEATDDPGALEAGGALLPLGGLEYGHKGYALGLLVEVLTQGLGGHGRADEPTGWGAGVLALAISPAAFGSADDFVRQVDCLGDACTRSTPLESGAPVRLPGQAALERKRTAEREGLVLFPGIADQLRALAERYSRTMPDTLDR